MTVTVTVAILLPSLKANMYQMTRLKPLTFNESPILCIVWPHANPHSDSSMVNIYTFLFRGWGMRSKGGAGSKEEQQNNI